MGDSIWLPLLERLARRRSVVLGLHGIGSSRPGHDPHGLWRTPARFSADVELLRRAGFRFLTLGELAEAAAGERPPPGYAVLTFDDGMQDNHDVLLPLLEEMEVPATVFVITGLVGRPNPWLGGARLMTEDELRTLHARGVELGAHTVTHPDLSTLDYQACWREVAQSREDLEEMIGARVRSFAYPFGRFGEPAVRAVRDAGFLVAVSGGQDRGSASDLLRLDRTMLSHRHGTPSLVLKATGAYDPLFDSSAGRFARAATRLVRTRIRQALEPDA